jgi:hypothetical protein
MPNIRRKLIPARGPLSPAMRLYLETGDFLGGPPDVDAYRLAGQVLRRDLAPLAETWQRHAAEIMATWPHARPPWAALRLAGRHDREAAKGEIAPPLGIGAPRTTGNGHGPER